MHPIVTYIPYSPPPPPPPRKKSIRIMTISLNLTHTETLFINVETLPLDKLIFNRIAIIMYKYMNYMLPSVSLC